VRYALLFSGMSFRRHVNGLEFCYRTLVDKLGFDPANLRVLNYDGSLRAFADPDGASNRAWPGDGTPFRMTVTADGSRHSFRAALRDIGKQLTADDDLFINTTGHGGHHGGVHGPDLLCYPYSECYGRDELCADIAALPPHRSLVVLMAQCFSGGFNQAVVAASPAETTFIAAASAETGQSFRVLEDDNWDSFQRNWVAALGGQDVNGAPLEAPVARTGSAPVTGGNAPVTVRAAFEYALACAGMNPYDSPAFAARPANAGELTLGPFLL